MNQTPEQQIELSRKFEASFSVKGPRILIRRISASEANPSSIILVEDTKKKERQRSVRGIVLQVGETCYNLPSQRTRGGEQKVWCKVGDHVYFGQFAGCSIIDEGFDDLIVINDEDILGVLSGD